MSRKKTYTILAGILGLLLIGWFLRLDDRLSYFIKDLKTSEAVKERSIWLPSYRADIMGASIPGIAENASGIAYDYDNGSLWVIVNGPPTLIEMDLDFNLLRRIELVNFKDTEGVAYAGNNRLLLIDERDQTIVLAKMNDETKLIDRNKSQKITLNLNGYGNKGFEGIAVDGDTNTIYVVRERDPMMVFMINGFIENENRIKIKNSEKIDVASRYLTDLSGLHYDAETKNLLILSDESKFLLEIGLAGNRVSYMDLVKGFNELEQSIPQAEGVTMDSEGRIYIVSEPNMIYRYTKR